VSNDKVAAGSKVRVQNNASRFGVKGSEDLGDGLKSIYQFEVEMDADGSTGAGLGKSRNSGVGLEGGFGKVILGIWDTPFKVARNKIELFDNTTSFSSIKVMGRTATLSNSTNTTVKAVASNDYNSRQKNSVTYWTPSLAGVQIAAAYKADETTNYKSSVSTSATFEMDSLYVAAAYEVRPDQSAAATNDSGVRLVAKYSLGDFWLGAAYEQLTTNYTTTFKATQANVELVGSVKFGASSLGVAYVKAGSPEASGTLSGVAQSGSAIDATATQTSLRYGYNFSKRTEVFAAYSALKNDTNVKYALAHASNGSTENVAGVGMILSF